MMFEVLLLLAASGVIGLGLVAAAYNLIQGKNGK